MTVLDLMMCAKPLIFENEDEEYSYSMQGTGFLARFKGRYFGITAKHCLETRTKESVRFELDEKGEKFLPLKAVHIPEVDGEPAFADRIF